MSLSLLACSTITLALVAQGGRERASVSGRIPAHLGKDTWNTKGAVRSIRQFAQQMYPKFEGRQPLAGVSLRS